MDLSLCDIHLHYDAIINVRKKNIKNYVQINIYRNFRNTWKIPLFVNDENERLQRKKLCQYI